MANTKIYDISSKLTNQTPKLKIDKDHVYDVDTSKNTILKFDELQRNQEENDIEYLNLLVGEEAAKEIDELLSNQPNYSENMRVVMFAGIAAATGQTYESVEQRFRINTKQQ